MVNASSPTHAGGVVYRLVNGMPEFLIVTARRRPTEWVLPKGHLEPGESPEETALREVREESGVVAAIVGHLKDVIATVNGDRQRIRFFLMKSVREGVSREGRRLRWLGRDQAVQQLTFANLRELIVHARALLDAPGSTGTHN